MKIRPRLGNISIRYKILVTSMAVFIPFAALTGTLAYKVMQNALEAHIESELTNTSETVRSMVQVSVRNSVRSYLRSVAETNLQLIEEAYERFRRGEITEARAKAAAAKIIASQKIGRSGYPYIVRSDGVAEVHPDPKVQGENFATMSFVIEQVRMKNGYIEYEWKNPDEKEPRGKALSMAYFKPWDWIISASAYRSEFADLVNVEDFRANVKSLKFGKSGYSFIFDLEGNLVVHPIFEGRNAFDVGEGEMDFLRKMLDTREGRITYAWKNPDDESSREKIVVYQYIPEMEWIVASSAYFDDLYAPLLLFRNNALWMSLLFVGAGLYLSYRVSNGIIGPVERLTVRLTGGKSRGTAGQGDEIERLSDIFERYMERLHLETKERHQAEILLRASEERYRAVIEATPDPIMVLDIDGEVAYLNAAFLDNFAWELEDLRGEERKRFVPPEEIDASVSFKARLFGGETVPPFESLRITKGGEARNVTISGGPYRDADGRVAGCVLVYRDITEFRRLEREVINANESERIRIGQDLHDDVTPHLIGIEVLVKVLRKHLEANDPKSRMDAEKIQTLISEAIHKTRMLARGLSPVHLAEEGLQTGVSQLIEMIELMTGANCELIWRGSARLDTTASIQLYRIVQEALQNATKHANADNIAVTWSAEPDHVSIAVTDDGVGMASPSGSRGMGMKIMAFRARTIGAALKIESAPGRGTTVSVALRMDAAETREEGADGGGGAL